MIFGEIFTSIRVRKQKLWTPKVKKITENIEFWSQKHTFLPPVAKPDHLESLNFLSRCSEECRYENMHDSGRSIQNIALRIIIQTWNEVKNAKIGRFQAVTRSGTVSPHCSGRSVLVHTLPVYIHFMFFPCRLLVIGRRNFILVSLERRIHKLLACEKKFDLRQYLLFFWGGYIFSKLKTF